MDALELYCELARLRAQIAPAAAAALTMAPECYETGYAVGRYETIVEICHLVREMETPPKASGAECWSEAARKWFEQAAKRDRDHVLVDWSDKWSTKPQ